MNNPLLEPLTRREQEILDLLAEGLTSREMAERLTLAVSSVRWYVQQIYGKLGVNGKRQAIIRAGELGLLRSEGLNSTIIKKTNPNNLPAQLTSFIGRETEITTLRHLITAGSTRLVTLTGSGGVGKTRLAIRAAEELLDDFADGTLFGAQANLYNWLKTTLSLAERDEYEQAMISSHAALGEKAFFTTWEEGQAMTVDEAVQYALGGNQK